MVQNTRPALSRFRQVRLDASIDQQLAALARRRGTNVSALIREAVIGYFFVPGDNEHFVMREAVA